MHSLYYICIGLFLFFTVWMFIEAQDYKIHKVQIRNKKIPKAFHNFNIIFLSDIHYGRIFRAKRLIKVVKEINELKPDIIILGGDYLDVSVKSKRDMSKFMEIEFNILKKLVAKKGIYTVLGNHDYFPGKFALREKIKSSSFKLLLNSNDFINIGKDQIEIVGVDDLLQGKTEVSLLEEVKDHFSIAVCHNPDFFSDYKKKIQYDLGLAGHTHGGQVTFFGIYAPYTSSKYGQKYVKKDISEENRTLIVSHGIGNGALPIRFFAKPDFVKITLKHI